MAIKIAAAFALIWGVIFLYWGIQLFRGNWLRSLAGNNFGEMPEEEAKKIAKRAGIANMFTAFICGLLALNLVYGIGNGLLNIIIVLVRIISPVIIVWA